MDLEANNGKELSYDKGITFYTDMLKGLAR